MRRTTALLFVVLLAGCLNGGQPHGSAASVAPAGHLWCDGSRCNFQATSDTPLRQANELSIAANPQNPLNMIATGKDYTPDQASDGQNNCVWAGVYTTFDGGKTWLDQNVPGSPWQKLRDPTAAYYPDSFSKYWCATDPVVAFGPDGTAYWAVMPYQCDRASGSNLGAGVVPQNPANGGGGFNDWLYTCSSMYILVSHDGGKSWPVREARLIAQGPLIAEDKEWIAVGPDGNTVLYCWDFDDPPSDYADGTPAGSVPVGQPGFVGTGSDVVCSVSHDKAKSWAGPYHTNSQGSFAWLSFDSHGTAWMATVGGTADGGNVFVASSKDGQTWTPPVKVAAYQMPPHTAAYTNERGWQTLQGSQFRLVPYAAIAADGGPSHALQLVWINMTAGDHPRGDIMYSSSVDGRNWTSPRSLPDVPASAGDRFMPSISVDPNGTVDASWYDRRDDPNNHLFNLYYTYSKDGGQTWAKNLRVSDTSSDEQYSHHQNGMVFLGDYRGQASTRMGAHLVWVDTRNHKADVFTAIVMR
ncbi:MAG: sialidase family protein [Thermoplasmatota archaeon]